MRCLILFSTLMTVVGCSIAPASGGQTIKSYPARGVVEKIGPDFSQVTIHHEAIPGYMMAMAMDFNVKDTNELSGISPKDEITFTLFVGDNDEWIGNIHRIGQAARTTAGKMSMPMDKSGTMGLFELRPGDPLPDYALVAEDGRQIHISDFRGRVLAFTFFYTRCPLPDYCPRMNNNFEQTRKILLADPKAPKNWELLSISFDPGYDTPAVLASYANVYRGDDTNRWLFVSAPTNVLRDATQRLDLSVLWQGNTLYSHNLRTVVLDSRGGVYRLFDGNRWTPQELADAIREVASATSPEPAAKTTRGGQKQE